MKAVIEKMIEEIQPAAIVNIEIGYGGKTKKFSLFDIFAVEDSDAKRKLVNC